jgi:hypothetical protein
MTGDELLLALRDARCRKVQADREIRLLVAYAREVVTPRPYRLADLAQAADMSISGVRTAYNRNDVKQAARLAGACGRHIESAVAMLLAPARH